MDDWESERPKEALPKVENKWQGEDEEEEVKDSWEDEEEEEKKDVEKPQVEPPKSAASKKPKKALAEKIDERERKSLEELQRKEEAKQKLLMKNLTPEELAAEKLRQRKLQEENELELVKATYGVEETPLTSIDKANPVRKDEFDKLREAMSKKIKEFSASEHFSSFSIQLIQSIGPCLSVTELKEVATSFNALATEKSKMDKAATSKKKGKQRAKLNRADDMGSELTEYLDDFDDFI